MARPIKWRQIKNIPTVTNFIPAENIDDLNKKNTLKLEELEAIRLKDLEGLEQDECAQSMHISRPTFRRILLSAREKIADSLINGKSISIDGGNFTQNICDLKCNVCGHTWRESYENINKLENQIVACPSCDSPNTTCVITDENKFCRRKCRNRCGNNTNI